jgi:hypothetical protein
VQPTWTEITPTARTSTSTTIEGTSIATVTLDGQYQIAERGPVGTPPTASITSPANNASFGGPADITLSANAGDTDGTVAQVAFYNGTTLIATDTTAPYSIVWTGVPAGSYTLTAKATDNQGLVTTSAPVNITVTAGQQLYFIHTDHLNTPRLITNNAAQPQVVWRWDNTEPFGDSLPNENPSPARLERDQRIIWFRLALWA